MREKFYSVFCCIRICQLVYSPTFSCLVLSGHFQQFEHYKHTAKSSDWKQYSKEGFFFQDIQTKRNWCLCYVGKQIRYHQFQNYLYTTYSTFITPAYITCTFITNSHKTAPRPTPSVLYLAMAILNMYGRFCTDMFRQHSPQPSSKYQPREYALYMLGYKNWENFFIYFQDKMFQTCFLIRGERYTLITIRFNL